MRLYCWSRWIYEETHGRISSQESRRSYCRKRDEFIESLQYGAKFYAYASSNKIPDAKAAVEKECEKLEKILAWQLTKVRTKTDVIAEGRNEGRKVHFASLMDICHLKMLNWTQNTKSTKVELYSEVILWKTIWGLMQSSLNKDHQHHKWQPPRSWISSPDCQVAMDKQQTQYQLIPK